MGPTRENKHTNLGWGNMYHLPQDIAQVCRIHLVTPKFQTSRNRKANTNNC